ncbi:MAG: CBS domain-containing protein [Candidatus Methylomirabilia bacterium]
MRRPETGTERRRSWWLALVAGAEELAGEYVKTHGIRATDVMMRNVVTVTEDASLGEIAQLLEERRIKRVPVVQGGKLVGIVSRADLLRGLATRQAQSEASPSADDRAIREKLLQILQREGWPVLAYVNIIVTDGSVHLWGLVDSEQERQALRVAAENAPGVRAVEDHLGEVAPLLEGRMIEGWWEVYGTSRARGPWPPAVFKGRCGIRSTPRYSWPSLASSSTSRSTAAAFGGAPSPGLPTYGADEEVSAHVGTGV